MLRTVPATIEYSVRHGGQFEADDDWMLFRAPGGLEAAEPLRDEAVRVLWSIGQNEEVSSLAPINTQEKRRNLLAH